jgi:crotonobetainyl-CoA:carnitine CoA-transferase CaiB-like acyl-CoA transferase
VADGWIAVAALTHAEIIAFTQLTGPDPAAFLGALTVTAALAALLAVGVPCEPALENQAEAFLSSAEHAASGLHTHYPHAQYGALQQVGALWDFDDLPLVLHRAPPALGEHSREVLAMLGFPASAIDVLVAQGITKL